MNTFETQGISPKAVFATLAALVAPLLVEAAVAIVKVLTDNPTVFDGLPPWARFAATTLLTALSVALAAYRGRPGVVVPTDEGRHAQRR